MRRAARIDLTAIVSLASRACRRTPRMVPLLPALHAAEQAPLSEGEGARDRGAACRAVRVAGGKLGDRRALTWRSRLTGRALLADSS